MPNLPRLHASGTSALILLAAVLYATIGQLWLTVVYPPHGSWPPDELAMALLQLCAVALFLLTALSPALRATGEWGWAKASMRGAVGALAGGLVLYSLAERAWWPNVSDGCSVWVSPAGDFADAVCMVPYPGELLERFAPWGMQSLAALLCASVAAVFVGAVAVSVQRRLPAARLGDRPGESESTLGGEYR